MPRTLTFPDGFLWGSATSSHQVEGGQRNDWSEWETHGKIHDGSVSGLAADHWNRFEADFDIAKALNHNAHRFGIEWSRIEPEYGEWNHGAVAHYQKVVASLKARRMEPFVTLWHFTNPRWFAAEGGWESPDAPCRFARYVEEVVRSLPQVTYWLTLNEPNVYALLSYLIGYWPPEVAAWRRALRVYRVMAKAHRMAYAAIKRVNPSARVGAALNVIDYVPARPAAGLDRLMARWCDRWYNRWFVDRAVGALDFIGVNHYVRQGIRVKSLRQPIVTEPRGEPRTDYGWGICPDAMHDVLMSMSRYGLPLYVTENGLADRKDQWRALYLKEYLASMHRAIQEGADVRGYFHWSLLDNFEWREGFSKRFGLVAVDVKTRQRTVRPSARTFAEICARNTLTLP